MVRRPRQALLPFPGTRLRGPDAHRPGIPARACRCRHLPRRRRLATPWPHGGALTLGAIPRCGPGPGLRRRPPAARYRRRRRAGTGRRCSGSPCQGNGCSAAYPGEAVSTCHGAGPPTAQALTGGKPVARCLAACQPGSPHPCRRRSRLADARSEQEGGTQMRTITSSCCPPALPAPGASAMSSSQLGQKSEMGGAKRPFRLKSPGTSDQEVLRQRYEREGNRGQVAGNQAPDDLFAWPVQPLRL